MGGPNIPGSLGPPGSNRGMGSGMNGPKDTWGQSQTQSRGGWGDDPISKPASSQGWGDDSTKRDNTSGWGSVGGDSQWNKPPRPSPQMQPANIRSSPSGWGDDTSSNSWSNNSRANGAGGSSKEAIWSSKQFKLLSEMGFRKDEVENTLRATNMRLEDALEILNTSRRPGGNSHLLDHGPIGGDGLDGPRGNMAANTPVGGGLGGLGGFGGSGRDLGHPGLLPPSVGGPNTLSHVSKPGGMTGGFGLSRQPTPQQPSTHQLRVLVQQIQMAVQAGHLNPQILNQPLAPQTLLLLNQLLQQIKQLQTLQQQHAAAARGPNSNPQAMMNVTVNITKTKQQLQNLQNQIQAQQANYLKAAPQSVNQQQPHLPENATSSTVQEMFMSLNLMGGEGNVSNNGSRLAQWKKDFAKAPGGLTQAKTPTSTNLLLDNGPWGSNSRGQEANGGGWPDSSKDNQDSDFGIPEFEPGKPWKGPGLKNPEEDPNITPGSVAAVSIDPLGKSNVSNTTSDSSLSTLTSQASTWSVGKDVGKDSSGWNNGTVSSNLTQIGQDLWGSGSNSTSKVGNGVLRGMPPGLGGGSNWPVSSSSGGGQGGWGSSVDSSASSAWLLLRNLTPQIDGTTLKTLCMQHGPLQHFELFLSHSMAMVMYASPREASKVS